MFAHLLVPLDGSQLAEAALPAALTLAERFDSAVTLLTVVRTPHIPGSLSGEAYGDLLLKMRQIAQDEATAYLKGLQGSLRQQGYRTHVHIVEGDAVALQIIDVADGLDVDTIVMCTHGRGGISRWVFGSVADKVLQRATVPVLLIRAEGGGAPELTMRS